MNRIGAPLAVATIAAMALVGCTTTTPEEEPGATGGTITIAEVNELTAFTSSTSDSNLDMNGKFMGYTRSSFYYLDESLNIIPDESFATIEKLSDEPLTVKYTLASTAGWSDGTPITANDLLLAWAVQSGYFDDFTMEAGEVVSGTRYFDYAGDTSGLALADRPVVGDNNMSITLTYPGDPFADWQLVNPIDAPLHVVAEHAGVSVDEIVAALLEHPRGDASNPNENETIKAVADSWNTMFTATSLPSDESLYLSSAAFVLDSWTPKQSITLVRNEAYQGNLVPNFDTLVIRFIGDAQAQVAALQNGEVDIISPQASADTIASLNALEGVTTLTGNQFAYDHLDITFGTDGPFSDPDVREAFMKVIPRQQILDAIVTPANPEAELYDSQIFFPGTEGYAETIKTNGADAYHEVDVEGAMALLDGRTPTVSILYNINNPNRVAAFQAIQASAQQAGFTVEDAGAENWGSLLGSGTYDASIFGWISSGVGVSGVPQIFGTGGGGNYNGYSNPEVDRLAAELQVTLGKAEQDAIQVQIDKLLWDDFYGTPLFVSPGVMAHSDSISGVVYYPGQAGVGWNFWEWTKSE